MTDRDVTRYFMTIPEAVQLVIQAGAIGNNGDALILDMGKPVRIADVAKQMIIVDSELKTWSMDPELLRALLARKAKQNRLPKAVLVVDLYGRCAGCDEIVPICAEYGLPLNENAAEALGGSSNGVC